MLRKLREKDLHQCKSFSRYFNQIVGALITKELLLAMVNQDQQEFVIVVATEFGVATSPPASLVSRISS